MAKMQNTMSSKSAESGDFYSSDEIDKFHAHYNVIFGKRSNGKTYNLLRKGLEHYYKYGTKNAYIRRWREDFKGKNGESLFEALIANGEIAEITEGKWTTVKYYSNRWYLFIK